MRQKIAGTQADEDGEDSEDSKDGVPSSEPFRDIAIQAAHQMDGFRDDQRGHKEGEPGQQGQ
jgi:hypothetical protein